MKSKASIKGHPLHPVLVVFPLAFLTGAFVLDVLFLIYKRERFELMATYAEAGGLIAAVFAAIPGIIDYFSIVPPKSSASKRGAVHGLVNLGALIVFTTAFLLRLQYALGMPMITAIEGLGTVLLGIAGWHGGTLVIRNQIGVDHRYANAGKWKEEEVTTGSNMVELTDTDKLGLNQMKLLRVNGKRIVLGRTESGLVAFEDRCSHRGASLADGVMICGTVQCPWHGSQFNVKTGAIFSGPGKDNIKVYGIRTENGRSWLIL